MAKRDGFVFYESFYDAISCLPDDAKLEAYRLLFEYALYGTEPETENSTALGFFKLMRPQIDANAKRRENGSKGGRVVTKEEPNPNQTETEPEPNCNLTVTESEPNPNLTGTEQEPKDKVKDKDKVKVKDKAKVKERESKGFAPPSLAEVAAYCHERGNKIDPQRFIDHYTANGWMVGKVKMQDWQAAIRTWESNDGEFSGRAAPPPPPPKKSSVYNEIYDRY